MLRAFGAGGRGGGGGVLRQILRKHRLRSADHGHHQSYFSPGDNDPGGHLFNETPPPPGQSRKWEDWELPYYATGVIAFFMLYIGLNAKPDTSIETWARKVAEVRLAEEEAAAAAAAALEVHSSAAAEAASP